MGIILRSLIRYQGFKGSGDSIFWGNLGSKLFTKVLAKLHTCLGKRCFPRHRCQFLAHLLFKKVPIPPSSLLEGLRYTYPPKEKGIWSPTFCWDSFLKSPPCLYLTCSTFVLVFPKREEGDMGTFLERRYAKN